MAMLVCDVCGGNLQMDASGKTATCQFCGMQYSIERMREKIQEIRGTVKVEGSVQARQTGTAEDVEQWRSLIHKYMSACDFKNAYDLIGKILQANPADEECTKLYPIVRGYCDFVVDNGILISYTGNRAEIVLPDMVKEIAPNVFCENRQIKRVVFPDSVEHIGRSAFWGSTLEELVIPQTSHLTVIGDLAFAKTGLTTVYIPALVSSIGDSAFFDCPLRSVKFADASAVRKIDNAAFASRAEIEDFPEHFSNLETAGRRILAGSVSIYRNDSEAMRLLQKNVFGEIWRQNGRCPACGSDNTKNALFVGHICSDCGARWSM